jgi:hypothetical protein
MFPGKVPPHGKLLHRSHIPDGLWYGCMLGDWSTRYRPGGMKVVDHPSRGWVVTPNTPLLPYIGAAVAGAADRSPPSSAPAVATASAEERRYA